MEDQMAEAIQRQMAHAQQAGMVDRRGWTTEQWVTDARSLMGNLDGAITSLVNGHVIELLRYVDELEQRHDDHDQAFYSEAFELAEAVRRFLARRTTQRVIDAELLDADVVGALVESADRMWSIRTQRVGAARSERGEG